MPRHRARRLLPLLAMTPPPLHRAAPAGAVRYDAVAAGLHWLMAALVLAQLALGWWMLGLPKHPPGLRADTFNLHKSLGLVLGALLLLRLAWRLAHRPPPWQALLPAWQRSAARLTHALLYAALIVMPASGFLGSSLSGYPVRVFGQVLPRWAPAWPAGKAAMSTLHLACAWLLMALLLLHVGAALMHALRRDGMAGRMPLPFLLRSPRP